MKIIFIYNTDTFIVFKYLDIPFLIIFVYLLVRLPTFDVFLHKSFDFPDSLAPRFDASLSSSAYSLRSSAGLGNVQATASAITVMIIIMIIGIG